MIGILAAIAVLLTADIALETNNNRVTSEKAQACVERMFSDPDAYDPGSHFEIRADEAPPFPNIVEWINGNLKSCLEDE